MEEKKKGNSGLIILVVLLFVACAIMGAFIFVNKDKLTAKGNTSSTVETDKKDTNDSKCKEVKTYDTTDEKIVKLVDSLTVMVGGNWKQFELFANDKKVVASDVDQLTAYHIAESTFFKNNAQSITLEEFTKEIQKHLGKNYTFKPEEINYKGQSCPQYNYDASAKRFTKQETACGWTTGPVGIHHLITKATESDGVLEINMRVVFGDNSSKYYADYARTKLLQEYNGSSTELNYSGASKYKFIFKNEDDNYVFVSSEPVNS